MTDCVILVIDATWRVDAAGYLLTPTGCKAARIVDGALLLYDKRAKAEVPFTLADWQRWVTQTRSHKP